MEKRMEKTDYKITEFHNSEFGSIRMIEDGGRLLFSGMDVAHHLEEFRCSFRLLALYWVNTATF